MRFIYEHLQSVLAALILITDIAYIVISRRLTPKGLLLVSPGVRRFRVAAGVLSLGSCLIPYYNSALGATFLIISLLFTGSLLRTAWLVHALGETEYLAFITSALRKTTRRAAFGFVFASAACFMLIGLVMLALSPHDTTWGFWPAVAIVYYAVLIALQQSLWLGGMFRRIRSGEPVA